MHWGVRTIALTALAVGLVAGCGSDDDDTAAVTVAPAVTVPEEVTVPDITLPDVTLPDVTLPDITLPEITLPDITVPDITIPDLTLPDLSDLSDLSDLDLSDIASAADAEDVVRQIWEQMGLDDKQVDCLIEKGPDGGSMPAPGELLSLLEKCDIDFTDLGG